MKYHPDSPIAIKLQRRKSKAFGRCISGIERHIVTKNPVFRDNKFSPLIHCKPCFLHMVLTSSNESAGKINDAWSSLLKHIKRQYPNFAYFKLRTDEGVKGVLHIIAYNDIFISKRWLEKHWSAAFKATIVWTTQCYGSKYGIVNYLLKYLKHHDVFSYGLSQNWVWSGWTKDMHEILNFTTIGIHGYENQLRIWKKLLYTKVDKPLLKVKTLDGLKLSGSIPVRRNRVSIRYATPDTSEGVWKTSLYSDKVSRRIKGIQSLPKG